MTRTLYQVPYLELTCAPKHALPQRVFRSARRPKCRNWCLEKQKINAAGQSQPKHWNAWPVPCLKTQRIGSEKTYGPKIHKWVTNSKGPHTINTANVGSIRDLISQNTLAGVTYLADEVQEDRNSCPLLRFCFIGSCRVGVSKRFSRSISRAVYCLNTHFILADQISYRSYVCSVYRMRSLAVCYSFILVLSARARCMTWHSNLRAL